MEIWKDIEGYDGSYQISNLGRVKSFKYHNGSAERILIPHKTKRGYLDLSLCKNNKKKTYRINRLVAQAFIPNPENKPEVNHLNGNKLENTTSNLEWATREENESHALDTGLKPRGSKQGLSKLTESQVIEIKRRLKVYKKGMCLVLGKIYGVSRTTIFDIKTGKSWSWLKF